MSVYSRPASGKNLSNILVWRTWHPSNNPVIALGITVCVNVLKGLKNSCITSHRFKKLKTDGKWNIRKTNLGYQYSGELIFNQGVLEQNNQDNQDLNVNIVKITVQKWFVPTKKKILPLGAEIVVLNYWIIKPFQRFWCLLRFSFDYCVRQAHGVVFPSAYPQKVQQEKEVDIKQKVGWKYLFLEKDLCLNMLPLYFMFGI